LIRYLVLLSALLSLVCISAAAQEADGAAVYRSRCAVCHGKDGVPKDFAKASAAFNDEAWKKTASPEQIEEVVAKGRKKMPAFQNKLTPEEIKAVSAYLLTL
jgi:mono/diheme cytochrome c family protein